MPMGDKKGPFGKGPMTGRAAGWCSGQEYPKFRSRQGGRRRGCCRGRGMRCGMGSFQERMSLEK